MKKISLSLGSASLWALIWTSLLTSCGQQGPPAEAPVAESKAPAPENAPPIQVESVQAIERQMPRYLQVIGELRSSLDSSVAADAAGKIVKASIERGSAVKVGDILMKLDERQAKLSLLEAEAGVAQAQAKHDWTAAEWKRNEPLAKSKAIADADFQKMTADQASAKADLEAAKARRDSAQKALADTSIRAPFTGTVAERLLSVGEYVQTNTQVVRLVATDKLRLIMNVPETDVGQIQEGQTVHFRVPAFPGQTFTGTVRFLGAVVREATRDLPIEAEVINADGKLRQGMFAEGQLLIGNSPTLAVPASSVRQTGGVSRVFVIDQDQIAERLVEVGEVHDNWVPIRQGLSKGESVVLKVGSDAVDGARIKVAMKSGS